MFHLYVAQFYFNICYSLMMSAIGMMIIAMSVPMTTAQERCTQCNFSSNGASCQCSSQWQTTEHKLDKTRSMRTEFFNIITPHFISVRIEMCCL